jgi:hypothetical protein
VASALAALSLPAGASASTGGVFAQLSSLLTQFAVAILAAIALVYLIMVATFRSLLKRSWRRSRHRIPRIGCESACEESVAVLRAARAPIAHSQFGLAQLTQMVEVAPSCNAA